MENKKTIVISLGGSLIVPDDVDVDFLKSFKAMIEEYVSAGYRFLLITGGGKVCRRYQVAGQAITPLSKDDVDWIGIAALTLNAQFTRILFGKLAHNRVLIDPVEIEGVTAPVVVCGAKEPGHSTDFDAIEFAEHIGAKLVMNLSNIDYAYTADPRKFPDAKPIEKTTWAEFRKILPEKWDPGLNAPFDPIASIRAEALGIEVIIMNGKNIPNLQAAIDGKQFVGTRIS